MIELMESNIISIVIFLLYILFILFIMLFVSSYAAAIIMLLFPIVFVILNPEESIKFLAHEQIEFFNGMVILNNFHVLLFIWSALFGIIVYTELISWYLSFESKRPDSIKIEKILTVTPRKSGSTSGTFKSIDRLVEEKDKRILDILSIGEDEASELIEMANKYRRNFDKRKRNI